VNTYYKWFCTIRIFGAKCGWSRYGKERLLDRRQWNLIKALTSPREGSGGEASKQAGKHT
jgi:hypothetical protein